jgi:choline dehydrogenase-like flavoprotein
VGVENGEMIINVSFQHDDLDFWNVMDQTTYEIGDVLANGNQVEYQQADGSWSCEKPPSIRNTGLVHEAGTLWMGESPETSVSNNHGRLHDVHNVYGTGGMLFPRPGSWNPTYTGMTMAFGMARRFAHEHGKRALTAQKG